jgi:hypothetical protein
MLGYTHLLAERNRDDEKQISALVSAIPSDSLPKDVVIIPYKFDTATNASEKLLVGIFEAPWSAEEALKARYRRGDIHAIVSNRWGEWRVSYFNDGATAERLQIQDTPVPLDRALVVTYENAEAKPVESLLLTTESGETRTINLPLAQQLSTRGVITAKTLKLKASVP